MLMAWVMLAVAVYTMACMFQSQREAAASYSEVTRIHLDQSEISSSSFQPSDGEDGEQSVNPAGPGGAPRPPHGCRGPRQPAHRCLRPCSGGHQGKHRRPLQLPRTYSPLPVADKASELAKALKKECNEACREKPSHVAQASHAEVLAPKDEVPLRAGRVQKVLLRPEACGRFLRG